MLESVYRPRTELCQPILIAPNKLCKLLDADITTAIAVHRIEQLSQDVVANVCNTHATTFSYCRFELIPVELARVVAVILSE